MSKFKVGDKVTFTEDGPEFFGSGSCGEVVDSEGSWYTVDFGNYGVWRLENHKIKPLHSSSEEHSVKYDLKAMDFDPTDNRIDCAFDWSASPEGSDYWSDFYYGKMTKEEEQEALDKWKSMERQWFFENFKNRTFDCGEHSLDNLSVAAEYKRDGSKTEADGYMIPPIGDLGKILNPKSDNVKHPNHYNQDGEIECIDAIRATLGSDGFMDYCKGNCMKYLWRYKYKSGIEDLEKAKVYLEWMIETLRESE